MTYRRCSRRTARSGTTRPNPHPHPHPHPPPNPDPNPNPNPNPNQVGDDEAEIDGLGEVYDGERVVDLNLNQRSEPSTPATPRSRSECATPAPMEVDEENVPPHSASARAVCSLEFN